MYRKDNTVHSQREQQKMCEHLWWKLIKRSVPSLHALGPEDWDNFELLDLYLRGCFESWWNQEGKLSSRFLVLLDECERALTQSFALLDGEARCYFCLCGRLARCILWGVDVKASYLRAVQEQTIDPGQESFF